jgi:hypothetical protein
MPENCFEIGILVAKRKLKGPWASHAWLPCAVLPAAPATSPWTRLSADEQEEIFYAGSFEVSLHRSETAHYRDNLASEHPSLWVALRHVGGDDYAAFHQERPFVKRKLDPADPEALARGGPRVSRRHER